MWVRSLDQEDSLEEGMATNSSILAWRIPVDRGAQWATVHGVAKSQMVEPLSAHSLVSTLTGWVDHESQAPE